MNKILVKVSKNPLIRNHRNKRQQRSSPSQFNLFSNNRIQLSIHLWFYIFRKTQQNFKNSLIFQTNIHRIYRIPKEFSIIYYCPKWHLKIKNRTKDISSFERIPKNLNKNQNKKTIQSIPVVDLICTFATILILSVNKFPTNIDFSNERVTILPEERVEEV